MLTTARELREVPAFNFTHQENYLTELNKWEKKFPGGAALAQQLRSAHQNLEQYVCLDGENTGRITYLPPFPPDTSSVTVQNFPFLESLPKNTSQLQGLELNRLPNLTHISNSLSALKHLQINECGIEELPDNMFELESAILSNCNELKTTLTGLRQLKSITVSNCFGVDLLTEELPQEIKIQWNWDYTIIDGDDSIQDCETFTMDKSQWEEITERKSELDARFIYYCNVDQWNDVFSGGDEVAYDLKMENYIGSGVLHLCGEESDQIFQLPLLPPKTTCVAIENFNNLESLPDNSWQLTELELYQLPSLTKISTDFSNLKVLEIEECGIEELPKEWQSIEDVEVTNCPCGNFSTLFNSSSGSSDSI